MALPDMNDIAAWAVGIPSIGILVAYGVSIIRRRISADIKDAGENKEYNSMLTTYKNERDTIRDDRDRTIARIAIIETERNDAVAKVGKLSAEVQFLSTQVLELKVLVERLSTNLDTSRIEMHKVAVENAKLASQVTYLESIIKQRKIPRD
jgi:outer membrane murein-binding lipoprotein Lpp